MRRLAVFGAVAVAAIGALVWFSPTGTPQKSEDPKPLVSVSTFALYEVARNVGKESIRVESIVPLGSDPHLFSPDPAQVARIGRSALFVYNGAGFEGWAHAMTATLPSAVAVLDMSRQVALHDAAEEHGHEDHAHHDHGATDPHYWLDIDNMIRMTRSMETRLSGLSPANAEVYRVNASAYIHELEKLKSDYDEGLKECKNRVLVSNHDAFGYLARAHRLQNVSVIGLSTDEQPSAKNIADIVSIVNTHGVKTVFFEELVDDNVARTIARETGAKALPLQSLANISEDELKSHQTYLSIMRANLAKLREAMECR